MSMAEEATTLQGPVIAGSSRIARVCGRGTSLAALVGRLLHLCQEGLTRMYLPDEHLFAFTLKRRSHGSLLREGRSTRYSAIAALGAMRLSDEAQRRIFVGRTAAEHCGQLIDRLTGATDPGDLALITWAAAEMGLPNLGVALNRLIAATREHADTTTVEAAWILTALVSARQKLADALDIERARARLLRAWSRESGIFAHATRPDLLAWYRSHVSDFADQVYPIQALSRYHAAVRDGPALAVAARCAEAICRLQGEAGQWWWHYDCRTGRVIEGYPVYSVHQDSMAPMALMDLLEAGGPDYSEAIRRGLTWLLCAPEVRQSLIDENSGVIWRKVARPGPKKLVRSIRAGASRLHPGLRFGWLDTLFPPTQIDFEERPYHLGWVLHAWLGHA
jgi:hypothetical protein